MVWAVTDGTRSTPRLTMKMGWDDGRRSGGPRRPLPGIVTLRGGRRVSETPEPRVSAFIWGGKVRPAPTLPYGRWKGAA